jgi:hypothetical protein
LHKRLKGITIVLNVKILGLQYPERYVIRRLVAAVQQELLSNSIHLDLEITEVTDPGEIGKYAFVLVLPTLVIDENVVCSGRFPTKEEVATWLMEAARGKQPAPIPLP